MKIIFLSYVNRSGSTYLTNLLTGSAEIMGCPEGDWLVSNLLEDPTATYNGGQDLAEIFSNDPKMRFWQLEREDLINVSAGQSNMEVFIEIVVALAKKNKPGATRAVFKSERLVYLYDKLFRCRDYRSDLLFLYIYRDIRAVWHSQKSTVNPLTGRVFSDNPVITSYFWKRHVEAFQKKSLTMNIIVINYEKLILKKNEIHRELETKIGLPRPTIEEGKGDYIRMIPPDHRDIHSDISAGAIGAKANRWKDLLTDREIQVIEYIAKRPMFELGHGFAQNNKHMNPLLAWQIHGIIILYDLGRLIRKILYKLGSFE